MHVFVSLLLSLAMLAFFLQHCVAVAVNRNQSTGSTYQEHTTPSSKPSTMTAQTHGSFHLVSVSHIQSLLEPLHVERTTDWQIHSTREHKHT